MKTLFIATLAILSISGSTLPIELETKSLLDNKIELKIPKGFQVMSKQMLDRKYPAGRKPQVVYTNKTGGINVGVNLTDNKADQSNIHNYVALLVNSFRKSFPAADWKSQGVETINGRKVGHLELITQAADTDIYNLIFITDLNGKLLLCTFNCTIKNIEEWDPVARIIMNSLKVK